MADYNDRNFYSASSAEGLWENQFLGQPPSVDYSDEQAHGILASPYDMVPGQVIVPSTAGFGNRHSDIFVDRCLMSGSSESVAEAAFRAWDESWTNFYLSANAQQSQVEQAGSSNPDPEGTIVTGVHTAPSVPSSGRHLLPSNFQRTK